MLVPIVKWDCDTLKRRTPENATMTTHWIKQYFKFLRHKYQAPDAHKINIGSFHLLSEATMLWWLMRAWRRGKLFVDHRIARPGFRRLSSVQCSHKNMRRATGFVRSLSNDKSPPFRWWWSRNSIEPWKPWSYQRTAWSRFSVSWESFAWTCTQKSSPNSATFCSSLIFHLQSLTKLIRN